MITRVLSTRSGALAMATMLALISAGAVLLYATKYRSGVDSSSGGVKVLVATQTIPQFTPGSQVAQGHMYRLQEVSTSAMVDGAITNPDTLNGLVARNDVYPGEQLTTNQFQRSTTTSVAVKLKPNQRAISFPVDQASGLIGEVQAGDHMDVMATFDVIPVGRNGLPISGAQAIALTKTLVSDALVLQAPTAAKSGSSGDATLTLAINVNDATRVVFAEDKGDTWFVLRPPGTAANVTSRVMDVGGVLNGANGATGPVLKLTGAR
ncbi:MAG: Flp pilus assembly protein CpaB [Gaiellales bacterium]